MWQLKTRFEPFVHPNLSANVAGHPTVSCGVERLRFEAQFLRLP